MGSYDLRSLPQGAPVITSANVARILGLSARVRSQNDLRRAIARGLPKRALGSVVAYVVTDAEEAARLRNRLVAPATYKRRTTTLKPDESERIERVARVMAQAEYAFGSADDARQFLLAPHPELGEERPLDAAQTELGARLVEEVLWRMEYGLPV